MAKKKSLNSDLIKENNRLREIFEEKKQKLRINQADLAEKMGISQVAVSYYLNGVNALNISTAYQFAKILEVPIDAFSQRLADEISQIAETLSVNNARQINNNSGSNNSFENNVIENQTNNFFKENKKTTQTKTMPDTSMTPVIPENTPLWIDRNDTNLRNGKIYLIQYGGMEQIRKLFAEPNNQIRLIPYNTQEYNTYTAPAEQVVILGRVIEWRVID